MTIYLITAYGLLMSHLWLREYSNHKQTQYALDRAKVELVKAHRVAEQQDKRLSDIDYDRRSLRVENADLRRQLHQARRDLTAAQHKADRIALAKGSQ